MAKIFLFILFVFCFISCRRDNVYTIDGIVKDKEFEGRKAYLVALDAVKTRDVDSTFVRNGRFVFTGRADSSKIKIVRVKAYWPKLVQDLLVVLEPGVIKVDIDTVSKGSGTTLNNAIQKWKEQKELSDIRLFSYTRVLYSEDSKKLKKDELDKIKHSIDSIQNAFNLYTINFIKENKNNCLAPFVFQLVEPSMSLNNKLDVLNMVDDNFKKNGNIIPIIEKIKKQRYKEIRRDEKH
jgi:hypothetical protein